MCAKEEAEKADHLERFLVVLRQALLMIVRWIEEEVGIHPICPHCKKPLKKYR